MRLVPSIDLTNGRSRLVYWPGASSGTGAPTDRPERIAAAFVALGAPMLHLVDLDGARQGVPVNTAAIAAVARDVAVPLQLAGGVDGPRQIELAFAAGATRVVVPVWIAAESLEGLRECVKAAGDWLSVGLDAREEQMRSYPWPGGAVPTLDELAGTLAAEGVRRLVVSHWTVADLPRLSAIAARHDVALQLAGGITEPGQVDAVSAAGIDTLILGEALLSGTIDYQQKVRVNG
jgi:phosphoribosylformimino-5-aminoimidazole carboxamide ribotide isomerase